MRFMVYLLLGIAIDVVATLVLKDSQHLTRPGPTAMGLAGYGLSALFFTWSLDGIPICIASATWAGMVTAGCAVGGALWYGERVSLGAIAGVALIILGAVVLQATSAPGPDVIARAD